MITGFLHPGAMGASLAAACHGERLWAGSGRSEASRERAAAAGMIEVASLAELARRAELIVSVCPPESAEEVAATVAATGFGGIYADVNAIAPATARRIGERFARFVDGGIVGPPTGTAGTTRLYLAGADAAEVAARWSGTVLDVKVVDGAVGAASAVKAAYAAWTKGSTALLLAVRAIARAEGVEQALLDEWAISLPTLEAQSITQATRSAPKAWRFAGEMRELAAAFSDADVPHGFLDAAAEVYTRLSHWKDATIIASAESADSIVGDVLTGGD